MALSTEDAARLASLKAARDRLISGSQVESVTAHGRRVDYGAADLNRLDAEICALEAEGASRTGRRRGAIGFRWRT
ncbi:gpW family head-tail joining protein [Brevundimonas sp.]|uniref:gpW family head-tail joining protein n=1 Tax=Brevundimonas sp. TaxID=1871086 RepID=UPI002D5510D9|nr:gpW family head-tail joining protein [Brevundimonas sp.]HYD26980.1 gpW family head-tail joining protein [Brevundimonas sp.]